MVPYKVLMGRASCIKLHVRVCVCYPSFLSCSTYPYTTEDGGSVHRNGLVKSASVGWLRDFSSTHNSLIIPTVFSYTVQIPSHSNVTYID